MTIPTPHPSPQAKKSIAATKVATSVAHLLGPGTLRIRNRIPYWQPRDGNPLWLLPKHLRILIIYGPAELTGAAIRLLWRHGVQLCFLNRRGTCLLGRLCPPANHSPSLACWQHWAVRDPQFLLSYARKLVTQKLTSIRQMAEHFGQRYKEDLASLLPLFDADLSHVAEASSLTSLRGYEGVASARWHATLRKLFPPSLPYPGRRRHPPTDPVNALLSLGYTLLLGRMQAQLSAGGLDPLVGVYHQLRPGKPALACDLIEPFRAPVVEHLVLAQIRQGCFQAKHFTETGQGVRLRREDFRRFLKIFEHWFTSSHTTPTFQVQVQQAVADFAAAVRRWAKEDRAARLPHPTTAAPEETSP